MGPVQIQCAFDAAISATSSIAFVRKATAPLFIAVTVIIVSRLPERAVAGQNAALHKYVIDSGGSLGIPTEPLRAYYHSIARTVSLI
jgi:hypothetical protein